MKNDFTKSLPDRLEEIIKKRILTGTIKLGGKISIQELAKEFEISSTPVRDTLNRLALRGIIEVNPRVGYFVKNYTRKEAEDLFYLRTILELGALRYSIGNFTEKEIKNLRELNRFYMEEKLASKHLYEFCQEGTPHLLIIKKCGNEILIEQYMKIYDQITALLYISQEDERVLENHTNVIDAIEQGDLNSCSIVLEQHIKDSFSKIEPYIN